jgi:predicted acylesterase/phospholipase RssA
MLPSNCCRSFTTSLESSLRRNSYAQLIGRVEPPCVAFDRLEVTSIRAFPAQGKQFPAVRPPDVRLMLGDTDITANIDAWDVGEIRFHLTAGSHSAAVFLQGQLLARNGLSDRALGRILDLGSAITGLNVRNLPGAAIGVIYPPEIRLFAINGQPVANAPIVLEACRDAVNVGWQVGMADTPGINVPDCARLTVDFVNEGGDVLASSNSTIGTLHWPPGQAGELSVELIATIRFDGRDLGPARKRAQVHLERRLGLDMRVPEVPRLIGSQHGTARVTVSCAAPRGGTHVDLESSNAATLSVPNFVVVREGDTFADFFVYSRPGRAGQVKVTATAVDHKPAEILLDVVDPQTAIVLSGGGSNGDFEVGACSYLLHVRWNELNVQSVVATSVGSINALGLATNDGAATAHLMEDQWLQLVRNGDMYTLAPWLVNVARESEIDVGGILLSLVGSGSGGGAGLDLDGLGTLSTLLGIPVIGNLTAFFERSDLDEIFTAADETLHYLAGDKTDGNGRLIAASSVLVLDPIAQILRQKVDVAKIAAGGISLRLCLVSLNDGNIYYVDERGHLLRSANGDILDEPVTSFGFAPDYTDQAGTLAEKLVAASIGSSAIPFFFAPVRLNTAQRTLTAVDGGVRSVLPTGAALEIGARLLVAIAASGPNVHDLGSAGVSPSANLVDIALRGIDVQGSEVATSNRREPAGACRGDVEMVLIEPLGDQLHSSFEIDSAKIRMRFAYGWMRAFDEFLKREDPGRFQDASASTEQIFRQRVAIWEREEQALNDMLFTGRAHFGSPDARNPAVTNQISDLSVTEANELRSMKRDLFQLVYDRFVRFGEHSLPKAFGTPADFRSETIFQWWEQWEHVDPRLTPPTTEVGAPHLSLPGKPFDQQKLWDPNSGVSAPEPNAPQAPVVPADFVLAMTI